MPETKRIALCMASFAGCSTEILQQLVRVSFALGRRTDWEFMPFIIPRQRCEVACNNALKLMEEDEAKLPRGEGFTHVLWFDDDVALSPEDTIRLVECVDDEHPAVFALAFFRQYPYRPSLFKYRDWKGKPFFGALEMMTDYPPDELIRVSAAGLCAAAFDREIFRGLTRPYFRWIEGGPGRPSCTPDGWLCYQFLKQGIPVYCHTGIKAKHVGFPQIVDEALALQHKDAWLPVD